MRRARGRGGGGREGFGPWEESGKEASAHEEASGHEEREASGHGRKAEKEASAHEEREGAHELAMLIFERAGNELELCVDGLPML